MNLCKNKNAQIIKSGLFLSSNNIISYRKIIIYKIKHLSFSDSVTLEVTMPNKVLCTVYVNYTPKTTKHNELNGIYQNFNSFST